MCWWKVRLHQQLLPIHVSSCWLSKEWQSKARSPVKFKSWRVVCLWSFDDSVVMCVFPHYPGIDHNKQKWRQDASLLDSKCWQQIFQHSQCPLIQSLFFFFFFFFSDQQPCRSDLQSGWSYITSRPIEVFCRAPHLGHQISTMWPC